MEILLISGCQNSGKSEVIHNIVDWLVVTKGYNIVKSFKNNFVPNSRQYKDYVLLLEKDGKLVLVNSPSDNKSCIDKLYEAIDEIQNKQHKQIDVLITTIRRYDDPVHAYTCRLFGWQETTVDLLTSPQGVPFAKIIDSNGKPILEIPLVHIMKNSNFVAHNTWYKYHVIVAAEHILELPPYSL